MSWRNWNGNRIKENVRLGAINAVAKSGYVVLAASKQQVPLDEGFLLRSGIVIVKRNKIPIAIVCFGGGPGTGHPRIPYAILWHETQANFQHGRKWKYLKDPFSQLAGNALLTALSQELRGVL